MSDRTCSLPGCDREHAARGLCLKHYKRARNRGFTTAAHVCETCGESLEGRRGNTRFCGQECTFKAYYAKNSAKLIAYQRANYRENRADILAQQAAYSTQHRDDRRAYAQRHYVANRDAYIAKTRVWNAANRDRANLIRQAQRSRRITAITDGHVSERDWLRLVRHHRNCCAYCGVFVARPHMDHVVPLSRGGRHTIGNLLPTCRDCNCSKNRKLLTEWRQWQRRAGRPIAGGVA